MRYEISLTSEDGEKTFGLYLNPEWNSEEPSEEEDVDCDDEDEIENLPVIDDLTWQEAQMVAKHLNSVLYSEWKLGHEAGYRDGEQANSNQVQERVEKILIFAFVLGFICLLAKLLGF